MIGAPKIITSNGYLREGLGLATTIQKFDPNYINPKHWRLNDLGFLTNTWCTLYINRSDIEELINSYVTTSLEASFKNSATIFSVIGVLEELLTLDPSANYVTVTLHNISIDFSRTPTITEKNIIGGNSSVKQFFSNNSFDITINGFTAGSTAWSQDSKLMASLINLLSTGLPLYISNPELEIVTGVSRIVVFNYAFKQDPTNYHIKEFTIQCKSDEDIIIIQ